MIKITNNWLSKDLNEFLEKKFLHHTPHFFNSKSNNKQNENIFYSSFFNFDDPLINFLMFKLQKTININLIFKRVYINVQHPGMHGSFHKDRECELTALYMVCGEGDFEVKDKFLIPFEKNKLIVFNSNFIHKGHAPDKGTRITLAFKIEKNEG